MPFLSLGLWVTRLKQLWVDFCVGQFSLSNYNLSKHNTVASAYGPLGCLLLHSGLRPVSSKVLWH